MRRLLILAVLANFAIAVSSDAQSKPYTSADIITLLESGLSPARVTRRLDESCFAGELTAALTSRLRAAGATTELLEALRSKPCARPSETAPTAAAPVPASPPVSAAQVLLPMILEPSTLALEQGAERTLLARVLQDGAQREPRVPVTWFSTDTTIVTIVAGRIQARGVGEAVVVANGTGLQAATATVRVERARPSRVALQLESPTVRAGETVEVSADVFSVAGVKLPVDRPGCVDLGACVALSAVDTTIVRVEATLGMPMVRGIRPGSTSILAKLPGGLQSEAKVNVLAPRVVTVVLSPDSLRMQPGAQQRIRWTANGALGVLDTNLIGRPVWFSDNERVVLVQNGTVTALTEGQAIVRARIGDIESLPVRITVERPARLVALRPTVDTVRVVKGDTVTVGVRGVSPNATEFPTGDITWRVSNPRVLKLLPVQTDGSPTQARIAVTASEFGLFSITALSAAAQIQSTPIVLDVSERQKPKAPAAPRRGVSLTGLPDTVRLVARQTTELTAELLVDAGSRVPAAWSASWNSSDPAVVAVQGSLIAGRRSVASLTAGRTGTATISVSTSVAGSANVVVVVSESALSSAPSIPAPSPSSSSSSSPSLSSAGAAMPEERVLRAFAESLSEVIAGRDSSAVASLTQGSEPNAQKGLFRLLRTIQGTPTISIGSIGPSTEGSDEVILSLRVTWRGSFGGESRIVRFALVPDGAGRLIARVRDR